ncbi:hypothetical protein DFH07DRAFT_775584 [Mycena maculata]|uniref:Uncharacterized protein n=1 Tax=Mycena maculata TaxID=230809 RepID=A0AAD7N6H7_9AGAR|nr:hypothetical protein DFH07DRAFT_775584 [Mycena maculata]
MLADMVAEQYLTFVDHRGILYVRTQPLPDYHYLNPNFRDQHLAALQIAIDEHAAELSVNPRLSSATITWAEALKICEPKICEVEICELRNTHYFLGRLREPPADGCLFDLSSHPDPPIVAELLVARVTTGSATDALGALPLAFLTGRGGGSAGKGVRGGGSGPGEGVRAGGGRGGEARTGGEGVRGGGGGGGSGPGEGVHAGGSGAGKGGGGEARTGGAGCLRKNPEVPAPAPDANVVASWCHCMPVIPIKPSIQLPSYRMKHGQQVASGLGASNEDSWLHEAEVRLRCSEATSESSGSGLPGSGRNHVFAVQPAESRADENLRILHVQPSASCAGPSGPHGKGHPRALSAAKSPGHMEEGNTSTSCKGGFTIIRWHRLVPAEWGYNIGRSDDSYEDQPGTYWRERRRGAEAPSRYSDAKALRSPRTTKCLKDIAPEAMEMQSSSPSKAEDSDSDVRMSPSAKCKQKQAMKQCGKKKAEEVRRVDLA